MIKKNVDKLDEEEKKIEEINFDSIKLYSEI